MPAGRPRLHRPSPQYILWAPLPIIAIALWVQVTHRGIDVLFLGVAALLVVLLERSIGDWLGEAIGAVPAGLTFVVVIAGSAWLLLESSAGRGQTESFFRGAERRGYSTVLFKQSTPESSPVATPFSNVTPVESSGTVVPNPGRLAIVQEEPRQGGGGDPPRPEPSRTSGTSEPAAASREAQTARTSAEVRWNPFSRRREPVPLVPSHVSVEVFPKEVPLGAAAEIRAWVTADGKPVRDGFVQFTLDDQGARSVSLDSRGSAVVQVSPMFAGTHEARARFTGNDAIDASTAAVLLRVLPPGK